MRKKFGAIVMFLTLAGTACDTSEETVRMRLLEKDRLTGPFTLGDPAVPTARPVELGFGSDALWVLGEGAEVVVQVEVAHLDLVSCYDGCGRSCRPIDRVTRPWAERAWLELRGDLPDLWRAPVAGPPSRIEAVEGEVCAR